MPIMEIRHYFKDFLIRLFLKNGETWSKPYYNNQSLLSILAHSYNRNTESANWQYVGLLIA
jgi:hypothetical protein